MPNEKYEEEEIKAAVAYLVEKETIVHFGKYAAYNIYVLPKTK